MKAGKCKHFNGLINDYCAAGVAYGDFPGKTTSLPCKAVNNIHTCDKREYPTAAEIGEYESKVRKCLLQFNKFLRGESRSCPHCGQTLQSMEEVGRSVYGACGCRLYQGRLPGWYAAIQAEERQGE